MKRRVCVCDMQMKPQEEEIRWGELIEPQGTSTVISDVSEELT